MLKLGNDNFSLVNKFELVSSKNINIEDDNERVFEHIIDHGFENGCEFDNNDDKIIIKKIDNLIQKNKKDKIIEIASVTIPIILATYLAKKTYQSFTKKK